MDAETPPTVAEFVEYCEVQAGLLAGHVETMREEADALLDEIDDELAAARDQLQRRSGTGGTETPQSTNGPRSDAAGGDAIDADAVDALEEKQTLVEAKQARMRAFQSLAAGYTDIAAELRDADDEQDALERVLEFEADHDAPAYFDDRTTMLEAVRASTESDAT